MSENVIAVSTGTPNIVVTMPSYAILAQENTFEYTQIPNVIAINPSNERIQNEDEDEVTHEVFFGENIKRVLNVLTKK